MNYYGISGRERKLAELISKRGIIVFTPIGASNLLKEGRENTYRILSRMEDKDIIVRIEKGKYITRESLDDLHIYEIAGHIMEPSYISLWSGLHHYGYTAQVSQIVYVMVSRGRAPVYLNGQRIEFVKTKHFFGYVRDGGVVIAEPEKLFIDGLMYPRYTGGVDDIIESLTRAEIDGAKVVEYALRVGQRSLISRLGYALDITGKKFDSERLSRNISGSYVPLEPGNKVGKKIRKWRIIDNLK